MGPTDFLPGALSAVPPAGRALMLAAGLVAAALLAVIAARALRSAWVRRRFRTEFGVPLPRGVRAVRRRRGAQAGPGTYSLSFPVWRHAARDGTADRRRADNRLVWGTCTLVVGGFLVTCRNPLVMHSVVSALRACGTEVSLCDLELARYRRLLERERALSRADTAQGIYRAFSDRPRAFEEFCARLWEARGYRVRLTPPANDGGYDLVATRDGRTCVVECKCYAPRNRVGRPLVQKLVGANEAACADAAVFVTTSSFTEEALVYARRLGVECVDGDRLARAWEEAGGTRAVRARPVAPSDAWLGKQDVEALFPADCRG